MNQVSGQDTYKGTPADKPVDAANKPAPAKAAPVKSGVASTRSLTEADMLALKKFLVTGDQAIARQHDLVELHKRFVKMFETLNQGIGEMYVNKADKDRQILSERLDTMEEAVDRMEGALRIEFEPALRAAMADVVADTAKPKRRWLRGAILASALILGGILAGAAFQEPVRETVFSIVSGMETQFGNFKAFLSPNGGS